MPVSLAAHIESFAGVGKLARARGFRSVLDDELDPITPVPGVAAEMPGNMQRPAFSLEQQLAKRRIADTEGRSLETRAVCGGERAAHMLVIEYAHPRQAVRWKGEARFRVACPIGPYPIEQRHEFGIGACRRERAVDGERPRRCGGGHSGGEDLAQGTGARLP